MEGSHLDVILYMQTNVMYVMGRIVENTKEVLCGKHYRTLWYLQ